MESLAPFLEMLRNWPGAEWLRQSSTAYLFVNAAHILGIGLTLGAILPLDLRLLGLSRAPLETLAPFLVRAAGWGLALAIPTGIWLFSVKPGFYLGNTAFLWKLTLIGAAVVNVVLQHIGGPDRGFRRRGKIAGRTRLHAFISAALWLGVLLAGRWIGFL